MNGCGKRSKAIIFKGGGNSLLDPVFRDGAKIVAHLWNNELFSFDTSECFIPEQNNPYPLCVGQDKPECENCQLRADGELQLFGDKMDEEVNGICADEKQSLKTCKTCKNYTPNPGYRDGEMGACCFLKSITGDCMAVHQSRIGCEHYDKNIE